MQDLYEQIKQKLLKSDKILIISHRKPDADTLGSALALKIWLQKLGKKVTVACTDSPSSVFSFLPGVDEFVQDFDLKDFDLMVFVDCAASYMTNFQLKYDNLFDSDVPVVNIDHHSSNDNYGEINVIEPKVASVTLILFRMFRIWGVDIDHEMAICLIAGLYGDTGSFMHSNTSEEAYEAAAYLMERGATIADINRSLFMNKSVSTLRLWGRVLSNIQLTDNNVALAVVMNEDYEKADATPEQLSGVVDYINMVPGVDYAVLLNDDRKGHVKGSFRTRKNDVDLSALAKQYGGGGHPKASGFCIPGKLKEQSSYIIEDGESADRKAMDF